MIKELNLTDETVEELIADKKAQYILLSSEGENRALKYNNRYYVKDNLFGGYRMLNPWDK